MRFYQPDIERSVADAVGAASRRDQWLESVPERYGEAMRAKLTAALATSESEYAAARSRLEPLRGAAAAAPDGWDALLLPATARVAPLVTERDVREPLTRFTRGLNVTGQPVVTLPAPVRGLPVGIQVVGRLGRDDELVAVAGALEAAWAALRAGGR